MGSAVPRVVQATPQGQTNEKQRCIKKLQAIIDNVTIIEEISTDVVGVGNTVKIAYADDEDDIDQYKIVGSQEADPFESKISNESPIAQALMGHKVGDIVSVNSPNCNYEIKVIEIKQSLGSFLIFFLPKENK